MTWVTPIVDRTLVDVNYALEHQDSTLDLKGAFNASDINRIIGNSIYLRDMLNQYGFNVSFPNQPLLTEGDIPYINSVIKVMRDNVLSLVTAFYKFNNPPISYVNYFNYVIANDLELNLKITNDLLINMISELKYCGTFYCNDYISL